MLEFHSLTWDRLEVDESSGRNCNNFAQFPVLCIGFPQAYYGQIFTSIILNGIGLIRHRLNINVDVTTLHVYNKTLGGFSKGHFNFKLGISVQLHTTIAFKALFEDEITISRK